MEGLIRRHWGVSDDATYVGFMDRFPILFQKKGLSMTQTCMCWGIECPIGWWHVLDQLCTHLEFHNIEFSRSHGVAVVAEQVKEKFGSLRFYFDVVDVDQDGRMVSHEEKSSEHYVNPLLPDAQRQIVVEHLMAVANQLVEEAEHLTLWTCQDCGTPLDEKNRVQTSGWVSYICRECEGRRDEARKAREAERSRSGQG